MATVVDNLTSDSTTDALSAKQGKELNNKLEALENYSKEEKIVGKWKDGKNIYRKVISGNTPEPDANGTTWYDLINNVKNLVNVYGTIGGRPYNYISILRSGSYTLAFDITLSNNKLQYRNLGYVANQTFELTIEYTKTTD